MPPAYTFLFEYSNSSIISIALIFGAPETVPAGKADNNDLNFDNNVDYQDAVDMHEIKQIHNGNYMGFDGLYETESEVDSKTTILGIGASYIFNGQFELRGGYSSLKIKSDINTSLDIDGTAFGASGYYYIKNQLN